MNQKLNFVYFGTPDFAVYALDELKSKGFLPSLVVTAPDIKVGRGNNFESPPVKKWANKNEIRTLQPEKIDQSFIDILREKNYDVFILVAYGKLLPNELLKIPKHGILNTHPSLLPRLRGASPVRSAILNNERNTGTTIIVLDEKMDHGPIVAQEKVEIREEDWPPILPKLEEILFKKGAEILVSILEDYVKGKIKLKTQDESQATLSRKIKKEDGLVDLEKDAPKEIYAKYCAFYGWPGIYFMKDGKRVKITKAKLEDGKFVIDKIIPENGKEIDYQNSIYV
jgi:methionyl-tRNA formyltransferase